MYIRILAISASMAAVLAVGSGCGGGNGDGDGDPDADAPADASADADIGDADAADSDSCPEGECGVNLEGRLLCEGSEHALVLIDQRLYEHVHDELNAWLRVACRRRGFAIRVIGFEGLDDLAPPDLRALVTDYHDAYADLEGVVFVGNVQLPTFFLSRIDTPQVRYWPRYYQDLDMVVDKTIPDGTVLDACGEGVPDADGFPRSWPCIAPGSLYSVPFAVPEHDFDGFDQGASYGPEIWAAFLPVGHGDFRRDTYGGWGDQLRGFLDKARRFHEEPEAFALDLYHLGNDLNMVAQLGTVWDLIGPDRIDYYAVNTLGEGLCADNPACYVRAPMEDHASLDDFLEYARAQPWMGEGWQDPEVFLRHLSSGEAFPRRVVWWNVHSTGELSVITSEEARDAIAPGMGGAIALLNGCMVGTFQRVGAELPRDRFPIPYPHNNILVSLVYGQSAFVAALGVTPLGTQDPLYGVLLDGVYVDTYLGEADRRRCIAQDRANDNRMGYRGHQNILIGDPFVDAMAL